MYCYFTGNLPLMTKVVYTLVDHIERFIIKPRKMQLTHIPLNIYIHVYRALLINCISLGFDVNLDLL